LSSQRVSPIWSGPWRLYNIPRLAERGVHAALSVALQGQRIATPGARTPAPQTAQPTPGAPHPIGPSSSPLRPSGLVVGLRARLRTHFLAVTGTGTRLPPKGPGQAPTATAVRRPDPVCPRRSSAAFFPCRPCAHAAVPPCTVSRRAPFRGMSSLALRWRAGARLAQTCSLRRSRRGKHCPPDLNTHAHTYSATRRHDCCFCLRWHFLLDTHRYA
jgi:hypothetical protein